MIKVTRQTADTIKRANWIPKVITPALLVLVATQVFNIAQYLQKIDDKTLDSIEIKYGLQEHLKDAPTAVETHKAEQRLIDVEEAVQGLQKSDSIAAADRKDFKSTLARIEKKVENIN